MKRFFTTVALALVAVCAFAQDSPLLRPRIEIAEMEDDNSSLEIFYMNDETPRMYYLSLGNLGVGTDIIQIGFDPVCELFIPLGETLEEALATMNTIKSYYKMPRKTSVEIMGIFSVAYPNKEPMTVTVTSRRFIFTKILEFSIPTESNGIVRATHISRADFNSILLSLKIYKGLHPNE